MNDISRLCIHTMTTRSWTLAEAAAAYARASVPAITVWRQHLAPEGLGTSRRILDDAGLQVAGLCRGGFFPAETEAARQEAIDDNRRAIDEAAAIGAPLVVLVCGALPAVSLTESRKMITDGIAAVLDHAEAVGVKLAIEPLHPMYADTRSAVNTLAQANDMAEAIAHPSVGVAVDVYHLWWDSSLENEISRAGKRIFAFHVCDWRVPTRDMLNDRGLMGEGCIDIKQIRAWVEGTGFAGPVEVEIFSNDYWSMDQIEYVEVLKRAYLEHV